MGRVSQSHLQSVLCFLQWLEPRKGKHILHLTEISSHEKCPTQINSAQTPKSCSVALILKEQKQKTKTSPQTIPQTL